MAYKTNALGKTLEAINDKMIAVKKMADAAIATMAASSVSAESIAGVRVQLKLFKASASSLAATPGLALFAKEQTNDVTYDVVAEYNAVVSAVDAAIAHIESAIPADGNGRLLIETWDTSPVGDRSPVNFTTGQTATLRGLLQNLSDTISVG